MMMDLIIATDPDQDGEYDELCLEGTGEMSDGFIMPKSWLWKEFLSVEMSEDTKTSEFNTAEEIARADDISKLQR